MKTIVFLVTMAVSASGFALQGDYTVKSIGSSKNTNTIFMETSVDIKDTTCSSKRIFRLKKDDVDADRFFAMAMTAQAQGKKLTIDYDASRCVNGDGTEVRVLRIKN